MVKYCPCKTLKSQNTWRTQLKRFLKNSNSQRCGFDRHVQPNAGKNIFCKIFATFLQNTRFSLWRTQLQRFLRNSKSQRCGFDRQLQPIAGRNILCKIFATFMKNTHFSLWTLERFLKNTCFCKKYFCLQWVAHVYQNRTSESWNFSKIS